MSLYIYVFLAVTMSATIALIKPKWDKFLYYVSWLVLTLFLCLRFGQGTDYPTYMCIYNYAKTALEPSLGFVYYLNNIHSEIGWKILMVIFQFFNIKFWVVTSLLGFITMLYSHLFIKKFCVSYKTLSLVLIYPTIYLTYYFSGIRQGLIMAIFYGVLLDKVFQRKYVQYVLGVLLLGTFHKVGLLLLFVPVILKMKKKHFEIGFVFSLVIAMAMTLRPMQNLIKSTAAVLGIWVEYFAQIEISWFSLAERILGLTIILVMWHMNNNEIKQKVAPFMKLYLASFLIYLCLCWNPFIASRIAILFKMVEIVLFPTLLVGQKNHIKKIVFVSCLTVSALMMYKNLNFYSEIYYEQISGYNLPYVSILNKYEILEYREEFINEAYDFRESEYLRN